MGQRFKSFIKGKGDRKSKTADPPEDKKNNIKKEVKGKVSVN